ncbi:MAG: alpha-L-fucosidase [Mucilaginibacter polytrichastri]|nr:alpha-L-fucosidase [Mucilaginibacter polytrichastri]
MKNTDLKRAALFSLLILCFVSASAQQKMIGRETDAEKTARMAWWTDARFGMFIHWGLYSLAARHEWVKQHEKIDNAGYQKYFDNFNPDHFEPKKWAKEAKAAGMKYAVLTTKHHEGFCLFDSKYTDYKSTNTAAKRDLVKEFVDAFRAEGIRIGFYYSLIDWHHPDFTVDMMHPQKPKDATDAAYAALNKGRDMGKYRTYLHNQVNELMSNYGKIDILWLDFSYPDKNGHGKGHDDWDAVNLIKMVRKKQPGIIIDNRADLGEYADGADFETPEQVEPKELEKFHGKTWETCQTFSGSWGYHRDENTWKTQRQLLDLLITSTANGGNLILNVGPTARGEFDYRANRALDSLSQWMHANSRAIYGCTYAPDGYFVPPGDRLSYNPKTKRLYLHLLEYPKGETLTLSGYKGKIKYAQLLNDESEILYSENGNDVVLKMSKNRPPYVVPVIELIL